MHLCLFACSFGHPYDYEIQVFQPTEAQLKEVEPIKPLPLEGTPLVLVETEEQLQDMVEQLKSVSAFAVDLEVCSSAHSTCMSQCCSYVYTYVRTYICTYIRDIMQQHDVPYVCVCMCVRTYVHT